MKTESHGIREKGAPDRIEGERGNLRTLESNTAKCVRSDTAQGGTRKWCEWDVVPVGRDVSLRRARFELTSEGVMSLRGAGYGSDEDDELKKRVRLFQPGVGQYGVWPGRDAYFATEMEEKDTEYPFSIVDNSDVSAGFGKSAFPLIDVGLTLIDLEG